MYEIKHIALDDNDKFVIPSKNIIQQKIGWDLCSEFNLGFKGGKLTSNKRQFVIGKSYDYLLGAILFISLGLFFIKSYGDYRMTILGVLISCYGAMMLLYKNNFVIDKAKKIYYFERKYIKNRFSINKTKKHTYKDFGKTDEIYAIQLIPNFIINDDEEYYAYEINLVFKTGERLNIMQSIQMPAASRNASELAIWLDIPIWAVIER